MKWRYTARNLNTAQRIVLWLGCTLLIVAALYPEFDTAYELVNEKHQLLATLNPQIKREFILNGLIRKTNVLDAVGEFNPELRRLIADESDWRSMTPFLKSERLRIWNVLLQALAIVAITVGWIWALKDYRKLQSTQH